MSTSSFLEKIYFVNNGIKYGTFIVPINIDESWINILELPELRIDKINVNDFEKAIKDKIIELADTLPTEVFNVCKDQYLNIVNKSDK